MDKPAGYYVSASSYPSNVGGNSLTIEQIYEVLDTFTDCYDTAMRGLSEAAEPYNAKDSS